MEAVNRVQLKQTLEEYAHLTKSPGSSARAYISWNNHQWQVVKLNFFGQILRNYFGFFSSTHLKTIAPQLRGIELPFIEKKFTPWKKKEEKSLSEEAFLTHQKVVNCWLKKSQSKGNYPKISTLSLTDHEFLRIFKVALTAGIKEIEREMDREGLFRIPPSEEALHNRKYEIFAGKSPFFSQETSPEVIYASLLKHLMSEFGERMENLLKIGGLELKLQMGELKNVIADYMKRQEKNFIEKDSNWHGKESLAFPQLFPICAALGFKF